MRPGRLVSRRIATPLGAMVAAATPRGVCFLEFSDARIPPAIRAPGDSAHLDRLEAELAAYFAGTLRRFRVALDLSGTLFQKAVWKRVTGIPYGSTWTYAELARRSGRPSAVRAAGHANGRNPVSILVPCHRVVGSDGSLHGYGGGLWRKERLLEFEGANGVNRAGKSGRSSTRSRATALR